MNVRIDPHILDKDRVHGLQLNFSQNAVPVCHRLFRQHVAVGSHLIICVAHLHRDGVFLAGDQARQDVFLCRAQRIVGIIVGLLLAVHPDLGIFGALHQERNVFSCPVFRDKNLLLIDRIAGIGVFAVQMVGVDRCIPIALFIFVQRSRKDTGIGQGAVLWGIGTQFQLPDARQGFLIGNNVILKDCDRGIKRFVGRVNLRFIGGLVLEDRISFLDSRCKGVFGLFGRLTVFGSGPRAVQEGLGLPEQGFQVVPAIHVAGFLKSMHRSGQCIGSRLDGRFVGFRQGGGFQLCFIDRLLEEIDLFLGILADFLTGFCLADYLICVIKLIPQRCINALGGKEIQLRAGGHGCVYRFQTHIAGGNGRGEDRFFFGHIAFPGALCNGRVGVSIGADRDRIFADITVGIPVLPGQIRQLCQLDIPAQVYGDPVRGRSRGAAAGMPHRPGIAVDGQGRIAGVTAALFTGCGCRHR